MGVSSTQTMGLNAMSTIVYNTDVNVIHFGIPAADGRFGLKARGRWANAM
jgi:hypothetical protein